MNTGNIPFRITVGLLALGCFIAAPFCIAEAAPEQTAVITNVVAARYGSFLKISYNLSTSDGEAAFVCAACSADGGAAFPYAVRTAAGDVNQRVSPGADRWFAWDFHADGLEGFIGEAQVRVIGGLHAGVEATFGDIAFCWAPPGTFIMGSPEEEVGRNDNEGPQRQVTLTKGFWLSKYPITQGQWRTIMEEPPLIVDGDDYPMHSASWTDIAGPGGFLDRCNAAYPGNDFRLPTEAEWEYACRAGTAARFFWGDDPEYEAIDAYAWHEGNNPSLAAQPVGGKQPNAWGLHDMAGNVFEWCADWYADYVAGDVVDPTGPAYEDLEYLYFRVIRGAPGFGAPELSRSASRYGWDPETPSLWNGFRLVRAVMTPKDNGDNKDVGDSPVFALDAREETLAPFAAGVPYTAVSALEDGVSEALRDLNGDGYPDAFNDADDDGAADAFFERDAENRYVGLLDANNNTFPDWFEDKYAAPVAKFVFDALDIDAITVTPRNVSVPGAPGPAAIVG